MAPYVLLPNTPSNPLPSPNPPPIITPDRKPFKELVPFTGHLPVIPSSNPLPDFWGLVWLVAIGLGFFLFFKYAKEF